MISEQNMNIITFDNARINLVMIHFWDVVGKSSGRQHQLS